MKQVIRTLLNIERSIKQGTIKADQAILAVYLNEAIQEVQTTALEFAITYSSEKNHEHYRNYSNLAKKYKAKLLMDLQEMLIEIQLKNINEKLILVTIQHLLDTNLYRNHVQASIDKFQSKTGFLKTEVLVIH
ncbi:hypothetical protein ACQ5SI_02375 [Peribacillus frigoritolerans]|uniref:hypothetical protein n=1 Tax=Peribacillus frigoritolerans TaxID=450367 RepID=UPI003D329B7D